MKFKHAALSIFDLDDVNCIILHVYACIRGSHVCIIHQIPFLL